MPVPAAWASLDLTCIKFAANIIAVFRYPAIFLLTAFLSIGSNFFQQIHLAEVNQELARIAPPKIVAKTPLKRLPEKFPAHDPATCAICVLLHAPIAGQFASAPSLEPIDRVGLIAADLPEALNPVHIAAEQCRGPPAV